LRAFEAAGRHLSFSRAAEELFVSQAAISRQVRELETFFGQPLFRRLHRRVELSDAGRRLLGQLTESFDAVDRRIDEILAAPRQSVVSISVEPYFAGSWLVPRLNRFQTSMPHIDVTIDVNMRLVQFRSDEPELAIRHSIANTSWPHTQARLLAECTAMPVISPALLAAGPPLELPADLANYTLLHEENRDAWSRWLEAAGIPDAQPQRGPIYADGALAIKAALLGHGVALGDIFLDSLEIEAGRLARPFTITIPFGAFWLVARDFDRLSAPARAFAEWLLTETAARRGANPERL
jgi:LysR family glycine cleavage system transcriptional activator